MVLLQQNPHVVSSVYSHGNVYFCDCVTCARSVEGVLYNKNNEKAKHCANYKRDFSELSRLYSRWVFQK